MLTEQQTEGGLLAVHNNKVRNVDSNPFNQHFLKTIIWLLGGVVPLNFTRIKNGKGLLAHISPGTEV